MAEQVPCAGLHLLPRTHRVVAEHDRLISDFEVIEIANPDERLLTFQESENRPALHLILRLIVVAPDQEVLAVEPSQDHVCLFYRRLECKIAKMIDPIPGLHLLVVAFNKNFGLLLHRREWPLTRFNDEAMAEVLI